MNHPIKFKDVTAVAAILWVLAAVLFLMAGCVKNPMAVLPPEDPEAVTRTALEAADVTIATATNFYADQKTICAENNFKNPPPAKTPAAAAKPVCRFGSAAALDSYRAKVELANGAFLIAVEAADAYRKIRNDPAATLEAKAAAERTMIEKRNAVSAAIKDAKP